MEQPTHRIQTVPNARDWLNERLLDALPRHQLLLDCVLTDPRFWEWPASIRHHHTYDGGLAVHTAQVAFNALQMLYGCANVRPGLLLLAAVWHDYAKIWDYERDAEGRWTKHPHYRRIGQVSRSYAEFFRAAHVLGGLEPDEIDFVGHLILSHHGRQEWGSPVTPDCAEAWALHAADMLSSHYLGDRKEG